MAARGGMSLLEMMIALALLATLMGLALDSLTGIRRYVGFEAARGELQYEGQRLLAIIGTDIAGSGWYIPPAGAADAPTPADLADPARDRAIRYYPYVQSHPVGVGAAFDAHAARAGLVPDPALMPPTLPTEHRLASREIVFVRTARAAAPGGIAQLDFTQPPPSIAAAVADRALGGTLDAVVTGLELRTDSGRLEVSVTWERVPGPAAAVDETMREYSYVVLPNPATGTGRLVRATRDGAGDLSGAVLDLSNVLSDRVDRVVFDTCRTDATLALDQVRVALWLSREVEGSPGHYATARVDGCFTMRAVGGSLPSARNRAQIMMVIP